MSQQHHRTILKAEGERRSLSLRRMVQGKPSICFRLVHIDEASGKGGVNHVAKASAATKEA